MITPTAQVRFGYWKIISAAVFAVPFLWSSETFAGGDIAAKKFDWPARKPGQWELGMTSGTLPESKVQICLDAASDDAMMRYGIKIATSCQQQKIVRKGEVISLTASCVDYGMNVTERTEVTGDFQSEYTVKFRVQITPGPGKTGGGLIETVHKWRWASTDCRDGMEPGDMMGAGGKRKYIEVGP